jgi:uncharacterized protein (TIGR03083 family)
MTERPYGIFAPSWYQTHIKASADGFAAAVKRGPVNARVPACPEWTLRDLAEHLGRVHEWAGAIAAAGQTLKHKTSGLTDDDDPVAWYTDRAARLLERLAATDPDQPCETHQPDNQRAAYWSRRQAHETAMHRVDAETAIGLPMRYYADLAADGIGEVLDVWIPVISKRIKPPCVTAPLLLDCADRDDRWLITPPSTAAPDELPKTSGPELSDDRAGDAAARISGAASDLILLLWQRHPTDAEEISVDGDRDVAEQFLASKTTV